MSGKEKPGVTRRPNRGRSTHDSKSKTDSGCFVDDELERNCSSDSSQGSITSSPAKETCSKKAKAVDKERKLDTLTPVSSPEPTVVNGNAQECILNLKENVMNEGGACNDKNERTSLENSDEVCDIVEKTQRASDFYCLYYSASPEGTLTRSDVRKVKSKPPVPPKPKARRGSAPPSSFNDIERICQQNKDITRRFSYNEGENGTPKPSLENFDERDKRKSVEERVLFFEAFAKDGLVENPLSKNVQTSGLSNLLGNHMQAKVTSQSESNLNSVCSGHMDFEKVASLAISKKLSFEKNSSESLNLSHVEQEHIPPLVEEEESTIDGSFLQKRSINYDTVNGDCHGNTMGMECPDCINEVDEIEDASHATVEKNPNGVSNVSFHESDECYSDLHLVEESRKDVKTNSVDSEIHNGFESFDVPTPEDDSNLQLLSKINASSEEMQQSSDCSYNATADHENTQRSFRGSLVNPRVNEIRQELSVSSRQHKGHGMQRRPGSTAGISNLEKGLTSQLKRRSWSFSEPVSPFGQKNYQASSPKLTPTSWQSENGLSLPRVRPCYQDRPGQITPGCLSISQERIGFSSQGQSWPAPLEHSGYASDDSSVHSEPLFQPQRHQSQILNNGHIFKSISHDSCISAVDGGMPAMSSIQCKRFRHSLGSRIDSRDPMHALRRQSVEFAHDSPHFQPVSHVQVPHLQRLRRTSSNASSSSDSEVERILSYSEAATPACPQFTKPSILNGLVKTGGKRRVSAMEALFGPQSVCTAQESPDSEKTKRMSHSEVCEFLPRPPEDEFLSGQLVDEEEEQEIEFDEIEQKEIEEPGLEFDDTDYSEFYTRCEDKDSIISAEALSIKKLLQSPQTVIRDPDIESVVMSVTERRVISTPSKDQNMQESASVACDNDAVDMNAYKVKHCGQFCRQHRGTQTPPAEVFRALSPPPSVGTQTPPLSFSQELLPPSLLRELQKDLQSPSPMMTRTMSPSTSQEWQSSSQDHFRAVSPTCTPFADTDLLSSLQNNADKAVSVEELLQILANMRVGPPNAETPKRRPVSVQKYNCSSTQDVKSRNSTNSLPSSWHHLDDGTTKQDDAGDFKQPSGIPSRFSKSYDCLRQGITREGKRGGLVQAQNVESREDIHQKLKEWRLRSQLFEEEVECLEDKDNLAKANGEKVVTVSYDGSESTENIETESKLTRTHSLKRPRKDRAFSQKERSVCETSCSDKKQQHFSFPTSKCNCEKSKDDGQVKDSSICSAAEVSKLELTSDPLFLEELQNAVGEPQMHEIASPEGVDVFIDYRKKHGMHITSTPKPPPYPDKGLVCREGGVGEMNFEIPITESLSTDKPVSTNATEEVPVDLEYQGDASSSSYSSDDDRFGEFGGSTDTVVFVDTEHSSEMSLVPDLDALDIDLMGNSNLLSIDNDDDGKDEDRLDVLLGEVRRSLNLEFVDSDILDKAIDRFKQRVSPGSQDNALSGGLSMEAYVALHQADELQGIISEIKGELKLLHDENDMLREQVVSLANQQTNGEIAENSSTESSERLENLYKLFKPKQIPMDTDDDEDTVEVDVCLRGFSVVPLGHLPGKKRDIHLGTVTVKGADWNGVMQAARQAFVEHIKKIDPDDYLCLGAHSIQGVQTGVVVWSPDSLRRKSPRVELSQKRNPCVIQLKDGSHFSCDSLVYDTLLPKETIEKYVEQLLEHRYIILCGEQGLGKSYLAAKLAEHVVQRIGWKGLPAVVTFNVTQTTRKELKQNLASVMETDTSSPQESRPAVIVLDQLNCLASLADIFDLSQLEKDRNCPYIIGVRDKSRKGPFSSKELSLCHYFRWLRVSVKDREYSGLLGRFLRRKLSWTRAQNKVEDDDLSQLFDWLTKVWYHLNEILEEYCEPDSTIGASLFFSCPMDFKSAEGWFVTVWNYIVIPYLHQALRSGRKIFDRCISWEDPTKWVVLRYPWDKDHSRFLHTLRKLRQVDVVLNRNHLGSDNVCFAECIEENEKILRAHSTVSKRVRTVIQQKVPKRDSKAKPRNAEEMEFLGHEDKDSCCSDSDSYLETSI